MWNKGRNFDLIELTRSIEDVMLSLKVKAILYGHLGLTNLSDKHLRLNQLKSVDCCVMMQLIFKQKLWYEDKFFNKKNL